MLVFFLFPAPLNLFGSHLIGRPNIMYPSVESLRKYLKLGMYSLHFHLVLLVMSQQVVEIASAAPFGRS